MLLALAVSTRAEVSPGRAGSFSSVLFLLLRSEFRSVSDVRDVVLQTSDTCVFTPTFLLKKTLMDLKVRSLHDTAGNTGRFSSSAAPRQPNRPESVVVLPPAGSTTSHSNPSKIQVTSM